MRTAIVIVATTAVLFAGCQSPPPGRFSSDDLDRIVLELLAQQVGRRVDAV